MGIFRQVEEWLPGLLRDRLPSNVHVTSSLKDGQEMPCVLVKTVPMVGKPSAYWRWKQRIDFEIHVYAEGIDAEADAADLAEDVRAILMELGESNLVLFDGAASLVECAIWKDPHRKSDWADSNSVVQFQDLPQATERFLIEARAVLHYRRV